MGSTAGMRAGTPVEARRWAVVTRAVTSWPVYFQIVWNRKDIVASWVAVDIEAMVRVCSKLALEQTGSSQEAEVAIT